MPVQSICGYNFAIVYIAFKLSVLIHQLAVNREIISILLDSHPYQLISRLFQFRGNDILLRCHIDSKRNQSRGHINILECSRHTVLTAN